MAQINLIFPILPGQREAHQELLSQVTGPRRAEMVERCKRLGVNWERGFYQETPMGTLFLLVCDLDDPSQFMPKLLEAATPFEQWFMSQAGPIHGIDAEKLKHAPAPEFMGEWHSQSNATSGKPDAAFAVPVQQVENWKAFFGKLLGEKRADFTAERARLGVTRETHFLHQTPMGAFTAIALEGTHMDQFGKKMSNPVNDFGHWFLEQVSTVNGFTKEVGEHMVIPAMCYDFDATKTLAAH